MCKAKTLSGKTCRRAGTHGGYCYQHRRGGSEEPDSKEPHVKPPRPPSTDRQPQPTIKTLKAELTARGVSFPSKIVKADLQRLLDEAGRGDVTATPEEDDPAPSPKDRIRSMLRVPPKRMYYNPIEKHLKAKLKRFLNYGYQVRGIMVVTDKVRSKHVDEDIDALLRKGEPVIEGNFEQRFKSYVHDEWIDARDTLSRKRERSLHDKNVFEALTTEQMIDELELKDGYVVRVYVETNVKSDAKDPYLVDGVTIDDVDNMYVRFNRDSTYDGTAFEINPSVDEVSWNLRGKDNYGEYVFFEYFPKKGTL